MESVGKHYGMDEGKAIYFSIIADSMEQAKAHQFGDAAHTLTKAGRHCNPESSAGQNATCNLIGVPQGPLSACIGLPGSGPGLGRDGRAPL